MLVPPYTFTGTFEPNISCQKEHPSAYPGAHKYIFIAIQLGNMGIRSPGLLQTPSDVRVRFHHYRGLGISGLNRSLCDETARFSDDTFITMFCLLMLEVRSNVSFPDQYRLQTLMPPFSCVALCFAPACVAATFRCSNPHPRCPRRSAKAHRDAGFATNPLELLFVRCQPVRPTPQITVALLTERTLQPRRSLL